MPRQLLAARQSKLKAFADAIPNTPGCRGRKGGNLEIPVRGSRRRRGDRSTISYPKPMKWGTNVLPRAEKTTGEGVEWLCMYGGSGGM
eukprot:scaffold225506_cov30-Tisochrysis_lutea.AAC.3